MRGQPFVVREVDWRSCHCAQLNLPPIKVRIDRSEDVAVIQVPIDNNGGRWVRIAQSAPDVHVLANNLGCSPGVFLGDNRIAGGGVTVECHTHEAWTGPAHRWLGGYWLRRRLEGRRPAGRKLNVLGLHSVYMEGWTIEPLIEAPCNQVLLHSRGHFTIEYLEKYSFTCHRLFALNLLAWASSSLPSLNPN